MAKRKQPYSPAEIFKRGPQKAHRGPDLTHIAFPLGGIGTGTVSLGGWGQLRDWEVLNRPAKGFVAPDSFFTLKVRQAGKEPVTKVVQGPALGDRFGDGHSMPRHSGEGLPHFRSVSFKGEYPFATVKFRDPDVPIRVTLDAFNPFIPLNARDSGIPVAIFVYRLKNSSRHEAQVTLFGNLSNLVGHPDPEGRANEARDVHGIAGLHCTTKKFAPSSSRYGSMALATTCEHADVWPQWKAGHGTLAKFWQAIAVEDDFPPPAGELTTGTVAAHAVIPPGTEVVIPFYLTWHFPVVEHWQRRRNEDGVEQAVTWRNHYGTQWTDAWDVMEYVVSNYDRLFEETRSFQRALFGSTLPTHVLDAVSSQISILRSSTCLRLEDGTFYGFEGCSNTSGCCEGSCTHVWNYAQALPYLFPDLQRSMMDAHFAHSMADDGFIQFRMPLPLGVKAKAGFLPAADGQMGLVMQVYRQWLITGDAAWLRAVWPRAKKALEFAWKYWDADRDGVMEGVQHNTYDMEWWGPNTMCGSLYLGALRAGEELATAAGDGAAADTYRALFDKGSAWTDAHLFNGEYYEQQVNPKANAVWPEPYRSTNDRGRDDKFPTWPRWQFGTGCLSDQLIGQGHATLLGLGHLLDKRNVKKTLRAIFQHNWRADLSAHACTLRIYAVNDEAGLIIATWPHGGRPGYAFWFADEVWCGIEYQVASHLICEGLLDEGLAIVKGLRDRYQGHQRNPWDEIECGHHYARSMASYSLLLALSGCRYSAPDQSLCFAPQVFAEDFRTFFCVGSGWGIYSQKITDKQVDLAVHVDYGSLALRRLVTSHVPRRAAQVRVQLGGIDRRGTLERVEEGHAIVFDRPVEIELGDSLKITIT